MKTAKLLLIALLILPLTTQSQRRKKKTDAPINTVQDSMFHGLKWRNVDFERRQILVREAFSRGRTEYTKNNGSQREIHMSNTVYEALMVQKLATASMGDYVFCNIVL